MAVWVHVRTVPIVVAALMVASLACSAALAAEHKRLLMLHSFGHNFKPWSEYAKSIRAELERQSPWPLDITDHSLAAAHLSDGDPEAPLAEYLRALFAKNPLDLIITIGAPAAAFVQRHRQDLFASTPMVFTAVEQRRIQYTNLTTYDTVVAVKHDLPAVIENILRLLPNTKAVTVINGTSPLEQFWLAEMRKEFKQFERRIDFAWTNNLSFEETLKRAAVLPPHSAIFWELMIVDAAGTAHRGDKALAKLHEVANAPIFSFDDSFFGGELVGGPMHSVLELSQRTAEVAIRILGGEEAGDIKIPPLGFATPKYDWREMQRWNISEKNLPPGSEIRFHEPTIWQQYFWWLILVIAVLVLQTALIAALIYEDRRRRKAEVEVRQRMSELAHTNRHATMGEMSTTLTHELSQPLGAILANTEVMEMMVNSRSPDINGLKEILADIKHADQRAADVIRRVRSILRKAPAEVKNLDLNDVVREVFEFIAIQANLRNVTLVNRPTPQSLSIEGDRIQLQQVIINLIINGIDAIADAPDGQRKIIGRTAWRNDGFAEVSISDFGPGLSEDDLKKVFDPFFSTKPEGMGMGLSIARTIVEAHNGRIWADNHAAGGAVFRLVLPLAKSVRENA
jgi:signal transduction histidine kinase/ABC-type uncharacterized transport system substrate-binding protein